MKHRGMTLMELLTVIAILAMLSAIIFAVAGPVRERARRAKCMANLSQIGVSLKLYKQDYNRYPPALMGYVEYENGGAIRQASAINGTLYPEYIKTVDIYKCDNNFFATNKTDAMRPVWPRYVTASSDAPHPSAGTNNAVLKRDGNPAEFYKWDSYDMGFNKRTGMYELRYTLGWTANYWDGNSANNSNDNLRQLGYISPKETAIVTWCSYHRGWKADKDGSGNEEHGMNDLVLFLDGSVKPIDSYKMSKFGWAYDPDDPSM